MAGAYCNLALVEQRFEHLDDARNLLDKSLVIERRLAREEPDDGFSQHMLARTLTLTGDLAARAGRGDVAQKAYREAVDLRVALVQKHPDVLEYRAALETTADNFGVFCSDRREDDLAQKYYEHALQQAERLASDYPQQPDYQSSLATALVNAAMLCERHGRLPLAEQFLSRAFQIRSTLQHDAPKNPDREEQLATVCRALATVETDTKHTERAEKHLRSAIAVFRRLSTAYPDRPFFANRLAASLTDLAGLLKSEQRNEQAIAAYQDAQKLLRILITAHPDGVEHRVDLTGTCVNLGNLRHRLAQTALAVTAFDEAIQSLPEAFRSKLDARGRSNLEKAFTGRGLAREAQRDLKGMADDFETAASLAPTGHARILRLMCVNSLAGGNQLDRAAAVAEPLVGDSGLEGPPAFDLAVLFIRAAVAAKADKQKPEKDRAALAEHRIQHGLSLLQRAFEAGYFADPSHRKKLQSSPFVPLLSTNPAFRKLVEAVEKSPLAKPQNPAK